MSGTGEPRRSRERKLPTQQLSILAVCRFAEPLAATSQAPYLPEMVRSFGVPEKQVGIWVGICAATFSVTQALTGIPWGRASDVYGRKPAILIGLVCTMFTSLLWGFSTNLGMAISARAIAGAGNGNVGILRTTVAEMVPFKELQPRAFSLMPLVWNIGSIFGPSIGGALANPAHVDPDHRPNSGPLLQRFPYALPNLVTAAFFLIGITTGTLFLKETLETRRDRRDWGLLIGKRIARVVKRQHHRLASVFRPHKDSEQADGHVASNGETEPLIKRTDVEEQGPQLKRVSTNTPPPAPPWSAVLNKQAILNLIAYTFIGMHAMSFDQMLPLFMEEKQCPGFSDDVSHGGPCPRGSSSNPLKFFNGFGITPFQYGLISTCYGAFCLVVQFLFFPPIARRLGVLFCLKCCAIIFPISYFLMPFAALFPTQTSQVAFAFAIMLLKGIGGTFAFPCSAILLTNSASSLRVLGTLNGIATSSTAVGRAVGPAMVGAMYTVGSYNGYMIAPWWFLTALGVLGAIPVFLLVEGEGFGGDEDNVEIDEDEEVQGMDREEADIIVEGYGHQPGPDSVLEHQHTDGIDEEQSEHGYGGVGPLGLSRTNTVSSAAFTEDEEDDEDASSRQTPSHSRRPSKTGSRKGKLTRRMSIPIGGTSVSRRYSSNLGQSLGSAGTFNGH